jgi:hypothetical protein
MQLPCVFFLAISLYAALPAAAHEPDIIVEAIVRAEGETTGNILAGGVQPPPTSTVDLKFREMFDLPVGPRGLEPSEKLLRLDGRRVRMIGYMVEQEVMRSFILAPLPLKLGDEDESLADDIPPCVVFVHFSAEGNRVLHHVPGLLEFTGMLSIGNFAEADGRVSTVRLTLASTTTQEISRHVSSQ